MTTDSPVVPEEPKGPTECQIEDGLITPCWALASVVSAPHVRRGIVSWTCLNMTTRTLARRLYGIKTTEHPNGLVFNFCPFCGVDHQPAHTAPSAARRALMEAQTGREKEEVDHG